MPTPTGIWSQEEANDGHVFDYKLAQWLGQYLPKDQPLIDMGCGFGTYLRYFHDIGFKSLYGVEGSKLNFEIGVVQVADLTQPVSLRITGNVLCLEVAEHIPVEGMDVFLDNILGHVADEHKLIISWAIPGQGGLGHVNCRHNIWVINYLNERGFGLLVDDSLMSRAMVSNYSPWLRNTLMIFEKA